METVLSGIRSTGNLHLGNYYGAVRNFVKMQHSNRCFFFIADYHSLTTHPKSDDFHRNAKQVLIEYLAAGLNPEKATLYIQSDVPEIFELYFILNTMAYKGELERTASFKEKARKQPDNVNAGLLTYPVLMAADILIHRADKVPVGKDQEQHLEMTRKYVRRFNQLYETEFFKEPEPYNFGNALIKIPGLDGSGKMGKSEGNGVFLSDPPELIRKKIMRAVTDSGPTEPNSEPTEPIRNLFTIMEVVSTPDTLAFFKQQYANCSIRYGDLKKQLAEDVIAAIEPIGKQIQELSKNPDYIAKVAREGAQKARESASKTLYEVRKIIGVRAI